MRSLESESVATTSIATLLLLGSFAFAYNVVSALHELGHVVGALATGGHPHSLVLHPFSTSSVEVSPDPRPLVTYGAGVLAPPVVGLALFRALRHVQAPVLLPVLLIPSIAWASSGLYLVVGAALQVGDAAVLMQTGIPRAALFAAGAACLPVSGLLARRLLRLIGIDRSSTPGRRAVILGGGIGTYLLAIIAWQVAREPSPIDAWLALAGGGGALLALIGGWAPRSVPLVREGRASPPLLSWREAAWALVLGVLMITVELLWF